MRDMVENLFLLFPLLFFLWSCSINRAPEVERSPIPQHSDSSGKELEEEMRRTDEELERSKELEF